VGISQICRTSSTLPIFPNTKLIPTPVPSSLTTSAVIPPQHPPLHLPPPAPPPRPRHPPPDIEPHQLPPRGPNPHHLRPAGPIPRRHPARLQIPHRHLHLHPIVSRARPSLQRQINDLPPRGSTRAIAVSGFDHLRGRGLGGGLRLEERDFAGGRAVEDSAMVGEGAGGGAEV